MAKRLYIVPVQMVLVPKVARGAKYFDTYAARATGSVLPELVGLGDANLETIDYGMEPSMLARAELTTAQQDALAAQPDVFVFPEDLDTTLGNARNQVVAQLEALNLPANHMPGSTAWRQVARGGIAVFSIAQRFNGHGYQRVFPESVTMQTRWGDLPEAHRLALRLSAVELGYDVSAITDDSMVRDFWTAVTSQASPRTMLGEVI